MRRLFFTGVSGFFGWNFCRSYAKDFETIGVYNRHPAKISDVATARVDITDFAELKEAFISLKPDIVIHAAAASQPNWCEENPAESRRLNLDAAVNLAGLAADADVPFIFTSSDLVFDGEHAPYKEDDPVSPINRYAEQKVLAEEGIRARHGRALICRMPLMFGDPGPFAENYMMNFLKSMRRGETMRLFTDERRTPASGGTAADGMRAVMESRTGTIHLGGRDRVSRHDFGVLLKDIFALTAARIEPCLRADVPMPAARPRDVSLDSSLAYSLGYDPPPLADQLRTLKDRS